MWKQFYPDSVPYPIDAIWVPVLSAVWDKAHASTHDCTLVDVIHIYKNNIPLVLIFKNLSRLVYVADRYQLVRLTRCSG